MMASGVCERNPRLWVGALAVSSLLLAGPASAADHIAGQVLGGGTPIANSTVTLWAARAGAPKQHAGAVGRIGHLYGVQTENCPPGMKTGDQISPPDGYVGGGLQMQTDLAIDPAGNV